MTANSAAAPVVRDVLGVYVEAVALAEPVLTAMWQERGVTLTQLAVLARLRGGPMPAGRLADAVGLSSASATRLLDRLERRGLVRRSRASLDRRCVEVSLEPAARDLLAAADGMLGSEPHRALEAMSAAARTTVWRGLSELVEAIHAERGTPPPPGGRTLAGRVVRR